MEWNPQSTFCIFLTLCMLRTLSPFHPPFEKKSTLVETDEKGALSLGERAPFSSVSTSVDFAQW
jgi:hypothetical protein